MSRNTHEPASSQYGAESPWSKDVAHPDLAHFGFVFSLGLLTGISLTGLLAWCCGVF